MRIPRKLKKLIKLRRSIWMQIPIEPMGKKDISYYLQWNKLF